MSIEPQKHQQMLIVMTVVVVALWAGDRLILKPLLSSWKARSEEIVTTRNAITRGQQLLERASFTRERWTAMRTNALPASVSSAEGSVLKTFDKWSQTSGLTINSIKPQWKHPEEDYMTLDCRVDASGTMAALSRFLFELERDPMALKIESLEMNSRDKDGGQLTLGLQVSGLYLTPTEP